MPPEEQEEEESFLEADDAEEVIPDDPDHPMDDENEDEETNILEELQLVNDSSAHLDVHQDSIFTIAQHPTHPEIVVTGGGDDVGYIFDSTPPPGPVLPTSYETNPQPTERESLKPILKLDGHQDSINAVAFTQPKGEYVVTAGLDGRLRAWKDVSRGGAGTSWKFVAETLEVQEINWLAPCPDPARPNVVALGANDGSVWVYTVDAEDTETPLNIMQAFYLHTESCTAGAWTPDGKLLATVSEDASFYVYDVFGEAASAGISGTGGSAQSIVGLTAQDQRFAVEGGLYSVAVAPTSAFAAVGGAGGNIRIVGLPRIGADGSTTAGAKGPSSKSKAGATKNTGGPAAAAGGGGAGQAGQILASLQAQTDGVETLSFSSAPVTLLAAGSVDGTIALYDHAHRFAVRRHIKEAHDGFAVVKVEFVPGSSVLTSAGMDGVVRQWETRGGTTAAGQGFLREWKGHRGDGEGGGVLGFVQSDGSRVVTAGDDSVSLVFAA